MNWIKTIPREEQFTSAVVIGELYKGAYSSKARDRHLNNIEKRVLPSITVVPYDVGIARVFGEIRAQLEESGNILPDADIQIAATSIHHNLDLVSGNLRHFERISSLNLNRILAEARQST